MQSSALPGIAFKQPCSLFETEFPFPPLHHPALADRGPVDGFSASQISGDG